MRPKTTHSSSELPASRFAPCTPPATCEGDDYQSQMPLGNDQIFEVDVYHTITPHTLTSPAAKRPLKGLPMNSLNTSAWKSIISYRNYFFKEITCRSTTVPAPPIPYLLIDLQTAHGVVDGGRDERHVQRLLLLETNRLHHDRATITNRQSLLEIANFLRAMFTTFAHHSPRTTPGRPSSRTRPSCAPWSLRTGSAWCKSFCYFGNVAIDTPHTLVTNSLYVVNVFLITAGSTSRAVASASAFSYFCNDKW